MNNGRYMVVGGNPFRSYTGTGTYTSLSVIGNGDTEEEVRKLVSEKYHDCGGLLIVIDRETGAEATF